MKISIIVARASNGVIGDKGGIPWDLPDDMKYFRETTRHHPVIMGRKTFDSLGMPDGLPLRLNVVITRTTRTDHDSVHYCPSMEDALDYVKMVSENFPDEFDFSEVFVIGGAEIYNLAEPLYADRIYLTEIYKPVKGDTSWNFDHDKWETFAPSIYHDFDAKHDVDFSFIVYKRRVKE